MSQAHRRGFLHRWRASAVRLAAIFSAIAAILVGTVAPAHADTASALTLCRIGYPGVTRSVGVDSWSGGRFGDRFQIQTGDVLRVTASGGIKIDSWPWATPWSANGSNEVAPPGGLWPAPGLRKFSLIGTFADTGQRVQLGNDTGCFVYNGAPSTFLFLRINDEWVHDNSGHWDVVAHLYSHHLRL